MTASGWVSEADLDPDRKLEGPPDSTDAFECLWRKIPSPTIKKENDQ